MNLPKKNPTLLIFDNLSSPLMIFNVAGDVSYANNAALKMESQPVQHLKKTAEIKEIVKNALMGQLKFPADMNITINGDQSRSFPGVFLQAPSGSDLIFLPTIQNSKNKSESGDQDLQMTSIIKLIRQDLSSNLQDLANKLNILLQRDGLRDTQLYDAQTAIKDLQIRLDRLTDLTNAFSGELQHFDDLLIMPEIVEAACQVLAPVARKFRIEFEIEGKDRELPQIYGNSRLIHRVVNEVLHHIILASREGVSDKERIKIQLSLMTTGSFLNVMVRSMGVISDTLHDREIAATAASHTPVPAAKPAPMQPRLGMAMAQHIVELHGGSLKARNDELKGAFVLFELPTGAPIKLNPELHMQQAKAYAADMSKLFERMRKSKK